MSLTLLKESILQKFDENDEIKTIHVDLKGTIVNVDDDSDVESFMNDYSHFTLIINRNESIKNPEPDVSPALEMLKSLINGVNELNRILNSNKSKICYLPENPAEGSLKESLPPKEENNPKSEISSLQGQASKLPKFDPNIESREESTVQDSSHPDPSVTCISETYHQLMSAGQSELNRISNILPMSAYSPQLGLLYPHSIPSEGLQSHPMYQTSEDASVSSLPVNLPPPQSLNPGSLPPSVRGNMPPNMSKMPGNIPPSGSLPHMMSPLGGNAPSTSQLPSGLPPSLPLPPHSMLPLPGNLPPPRSMSSVPGNLPPQSVHPLPGNLPSQSVHPLPGNLPPQSLYQLPGNLPPHYISHMPGNLPPHSMHPIPGKINPHSMPGNLLPPHSIHPMTGNLPPPHSIHPMTGNPTPHSMPPMSGNQSPHSIPPMPGNLTPHSMPPMPLHHNLPGGLPPAHSIPPMSGHMPPLNPMFSMPLRQNLPGNLAPPQSMSGNLPSSYPMPQNPYMYPSNQKNWQ